VASLVARALYARWLWPVRPPLVESPPQLLAGARTA
jgi:hypothetical protein